MPANIAIVSFGSNIDPEENARKARNILSAEEDVLDVSDFRWTDPVGMKDQPCFLNGVFLVSTEKAREDFRDYLKDVEDRLGRDRSVPKAGPRTADLDLLVWNGEVVHPDFHEADYIQDPLEEIMRRNGIEIRSEERNGGDPETGSDEPGRGSKSPSRGSGRERRDVPSGRSRKLDSASTGRSPEPGARIGSAGPEDEGSSGAEGNEGRPGGIGPEGTASPGPEGTGSPGPEGTARAGPEGAGS